ncbi:MAG: type I phosphomannose isomerase catalytic subunit [Chloroflexota bacterium]
MSYQPLLLNANLVTKVWGGRGLQTVMHKSLPTDDPYGESWELHDSATIASGPHAGRTLGDLLNEMGTDLVGESNDPADGFPLLAKFLDANDWLSIQVHPNDEQAAELEGEPRGKTEAWLVLHAEPGAKLVYGMQPGTSREAMAQSIRDGNLENYVVFKEVQQGDVLLMEANAVHALGPGLLIYEIQQSSNTTYRLYDWNRMGLDGKPRELHIDKGVKVSNMDFVPEVQSPWANAGDVVRVVECPYFATDLHRLSTDNAPVEIEPNGKFHALTCISGEMTVSSDGADVQASTGQTILVPAITKRYTLSGAGEVLSSFQP